MAEKKVIEVPGIKTGVLRAGGSGFEHVMNTTVLVNAPARMTMQVPLPKGLLLSIGCVATVAG